MKDNLIRRQYCLERENSVIIQMASKLEQKILCQKVQKNINEYIELMNRDI